MSGTDVGEQQQQHQYHARTPHTPTGYAATRYEDAARIREKRRVGFRPMGLRPCYAKFGTDIAYAPARPKQLLVPAVQETVNSAMVLRAC
eukprot:2893730-Rhodomonas_salina.10